MSELTKCNYCCLQWLRERVRADERLVVYPDPQPGFPDGQSVAIVPSTTPDDTTVLAFKSIGRAHTWFGALTDHCVC